MSWLILIDGWIGSCLGKLRRAEIKGPIIISFLLIIILYLERSRCLGK